MRLTLVDFHRFGTANHALSQTSRLRSLPLMFLINPIGTPHLCLSFAILLRGTKPLQLNRDSFRVYALSPSPSPLRNQSERIECEFQAWSFGVIR